MRKHLTPKVYESLLPLKTRYGVTIDSIISCGTACGYHIPRSMGCMAGDHESYTLFKPFFDPIIAEYHGFSPGGKHVTDLDSGRLSSVEDLDPNSEYILSTRIRVARSISGFPFPSAQTRSSRRHVEHLAKTCFDTLPNYGLNGQYISLNSMDNEENDDLIQRHILFDNPDEWAVTAGLGRDWPDARGLYVNVKDTDETPDFIVWVNEEDHLRIMCMRKGGDISGVFEQVVRGVNAIEEALERQGYGFLHDDHLGYVVGCPTNLGTGMRASCHVKLVLLSRCKGFESLCTRMGLDVRGKHGERDKKNSGIWDISNRHRLGFSEVELIQRMIDGVNYLVALEKKLEKGESVNCDEHFKE